MRGATRVGIIVALWLALGCEKTRDDPSAIDAAANGEKARGVDEIDASLAIADSNAPPAPSASSLAAPPLAGPPTWAALRDRVTAAGERVVAGRRFAFAFWDSRWIDLRLVAGRIEHRAAGVVDPTWLPDLVGAFNGGFRAVHGRYGIRVAHHTYVPPREGLATLVRCDEGWRLLTLEAPHLLEHCPDLRQNLAPLQIDGRFNPLAARAFGGLAPGKHDGRTTRTALGVTSSGWMAFVYGIDVTAEELAQASLEAGTVYAMALDINDGQTGFEWLQLGPRAPAASSAPTGSVSAPQRFSLRPAALGDPMAKRYRGQIHGMPLVAERLSTPMGTPLPRWVQGDARDYFVLVRSAVELPRARRWAEK